MSHPHRPTHEDSLYIPPSSTPSLRRLQILHPLSLLLLITSFSLTSLILSPSLPQVSKRHPTYFNPSTIWLLGYWGWLLLLQVGTALVVALAGGERTKSLLTKGMSVSLPLSNLMLAIWAPVFILDQRNGFIAGEVLLGLSAIMLLGSVLVTGSRAAFRPTWKRPGEWLLVHMPLRMFLAVLLQIDLWQQGLISFNLAPGGPPPSSTIWPTFIIIVSISLLSSFWIFATTDISFGLASIYLQLAILFARKGGVRVEDRPAELLAAHILSIVLMSVALLASLVWGRLVAGGATSGEGRIALGRNLAEEEAAAEQAEAEAVVAEQRATARREEAGRLSGHGGHAQGEEFTPCQLEEGQVGVTRKLGQRD